MAVFTELSDDALIQLGVVYGLGEATSIVGLADGDSETTYLLFTGDRQIVVTIFESHVEAFDLERAFLAMEALAAADVPCPTTIRTIAGEASAIIAGRLVALVEAVQGTCGQTANVSRCRSLGREIGKFHRTLSDRFPVRYPQRNGLPWGWVHGGLTPDNVFFLHDQVSGIINFRLRHEGYLLDEVAEVIATWCGPRYTLEVGLTRALLEGYESTRALSALERNRLPLFVMAAIARRRAVLQDNDDAATTEAVAGFWLIREAVG